MKGGRKIREGRGREGRRERGREKDSRGGQRY